MPLLPDHPAPQHERAPRPLPLFLELVREVSLTDPALARDALVGLRRYERAPRPAVRAPRPQVGRAGAATLRDYGGEGQPAVLVPSLINPPRILDLDEQVSLAGAIARMGRRALLIDWGSAGERAGLGISGHVEQLLLPLLSGLPQPPALIGYCLGGSMAIAAANLIPVERVATLATPWNFSAYPQASKEALARMWRHAEPAAKSFGALPMEVLQAAFWSLGPERTVRKFAAFGRFPEHSREARRFVELEEWANDGEPLPYPAASELIEELFERDVTGRGEWRIAGRRVTDGLRMPLLHLPAERDQIAPAATAPAGRQVHIPSGHVGMVVGSARHRVHEALAGFLME